jgi:hypothetical protein
MPMLGYLFFTAGVVLELLGFILVLKGKATSLEPIILGLVCLLIGFLAR